jgi:hypothetical protein
MKLYSIIIKSGRWKDYFYWGKGKFRKETKYWTRKEISRHLNYAIETAKYDLESPSGVIVNEYDMNIINSFSINSLEEFKTSKQRNDKINELLKDEK